MKIFRRLWALVLWTLGFFFLTFGLPISALWWLLSGNFIPWRFWIAAEYYGS